MKFWSRKKTPAKQWSPWSPGFFDRLVAATAAMRDENLIHLPGGKPISAELLKINRSIAEKMGTGFLRCNNCNRVQDLTADQVELYLHEGGWPVCCEGTHLGGQMRYCRAEERKRG